MCCSDYLFYVLIHNILVTLWALTKSYEGSQSKIVRANHYFIFSAHLCQIIWTNHFRKENLLEVFLKSVAEHFDVEVSIFPVFFSVSPCIICEFIDVNGFL